MSLITTEEIRKKFIDYFVSKNHKHVQASPLIPHNDPSLMFVNSGMVQFKDVFTGREKRDYTRAVTSQKSVRAGGKHNDLDNVGYTARHHTFFEMLGNFSFGDYFKEEAIYYSWDLLTNEFKLPKDKLYVTIYHTDEEAANFWKKIADLPDDRIIRIKTNDNFWSMGDTGPCGPCSEIFYDHGAHIAGGLPGSPEQDGDRYIEIWNMVFMQFEQISKDQRIELPQKSVDTGMGLERLSAVLQGVHDNYDIDLFRDIISYAENILKVKAENEARFSYRIIADHLRACAFLIADGIMPSNEGRGYVLRRIMRRGMRHAHQLGAKEPLIYKLLPKLIDLMDNAYPELKRAEDFISNILLQEELRFKTTLDRGLKLLDEEILHLKENKLPGEIAFKLYDTYGFPLDLTEDILKQKSISVDVKSFDQSMREQKERAKKSWIGSGESKESNIWLDIKSEFGSTEFLGYVLNNSEGKILALIQNNQKIAKIDNDKEFILIANQTPFYAESGGQMGDIGFITSDQCKIKVINSLKYASSIHAHICILETGFCAVGSDVKLNIDLQNRNNLRIHHSATHILHAVLREVLGAHVTQKGSLVAKDRLRFDISHSNSVSQDLIELIEDKVNKIIRENSKVDTKLMSVDDAIKEGAMALFGEKYDSEVRVVSMGQQDADKAYSYELCGGTHVNRTGDIGFFKIVSEGALAAGIRRIDAVCGEYAAKFARDNENLLNKMLLSLKASKNEVIDRIDSLLLSKKESEKELEKFKLAELDISSEEIEKIALKQNSNLLIYKILNNFDNKIVRSVAENLSKKKENLIIVFVNNSSGKLSINVAVSQNISNQHNALDLAKELSLFLGGSGGGGQATLAQAGGIDINKLENLGAKIIKLIS